MNKHLTLAIHEMVALMDDAADVILRKHVQIEFAAGRVLMTLRREQPCSQRRLAACLQVTPAAITRSLPAFLEAGWITAQVDPKQPRRNLLMLTPKGQALADTCWSVLETAFLELLNEVNVDPDTFQEQILRISAVLSQKGTHGDEQ